MSYSSISVAEDLLKVKDTELYHIGEEKFKELKDYAEHGSFTLKISGMAAGIAIVFVALTSIVGHMVTLSPFAAIIDIYLCALGCIMVLLEAKEYSMSQKYLEILKEEALCLYRPYGRGVFYFFVGILMASNGGLMGLGAGGYTAVVGAIMFKTSRDSANQFKEAVQSSSNGNNNNL